MDNYQNNNQNSYQQPPQYNPYPFNPDEYYGRNDPFATDAQGKSRGVAALLAILLGGLGIHYFYLGKTSAGIITIILSMCTCGLWQILMLIQGILMLVMTNYDFDQKYVYTQSSFPLF